MTQAPAARRIVFVGNCQMQAVHAVYRRFVTPHIPSVTSHIASYANLSDDARKLLASADIVVQQVQDFAAKVGTLDLPSTTQRYFAPVLAGNFMWPFGGRARPGNKPAPGLTEGPFPAQLGDSRLNQYIQQGTDPAEAARDYTALDVAAAANLDRLFEIIVSKQARLDNDLGYGVAPLITAHFRDEQLFRTIYHPGPRLVNHVAVTLFRQMGIDESILDRIGRLQKQVMLPHFESPIHPAVARHFGLTFAGPERTYQFLNEGACTFAEWVRRYLAGAWNQSLAAGISLSETPAETERALALLQDGLKGSPDSAVGWRACAVVLERLGRRSEALDAARRAVALDPDVPHFQLMLGHLSARTGNLAQAADCFAAALRLDPASAEAQRALVQMRTRLGDTDAALAMAETIIADPIEPPATDFLMQTATACRQRGRIQDALRMAGQATTIEPDDAGLRLQLAAWLHEAGRTDDATQALRAAEALAGDDAAMLMRIARVHADLGNIGHALALMQTATSLAPTRADVRAHAAHLLASLDQHEDAATECRAALLAQPTDDAMHLFHSTLLLKLGRRDAGIQAAERAIRLNPRNPAYHFHVGQVLQSGGNLAQAEISFANAVSFDERNPAYRLALAQTLHRQGKRADALAAVRDGLAVAPNDTALSALLKDLAPAP